MAAYSFTASFEKQLQEEKGEKLRSRWCTHHLGNCWPISLEPPAGAWQSQTVLAGAMTTYLWAPSSSWVASWSPMYTHSLIPQTFVSTYSEKNKQTKSQEDSNEADSPRLGKRHYSTRIHLLIWRRCHSLFPFSFTEQLFPLLFFIERWKAGDLIPQHLPLL